MALFRRSKQSTTNIPELQEYYASQTKESTGKAWLLAIGSLLITIVILLGAFFGGRWVYRKITNNDEPKKAATSQNESAGKSVSESSTKPSTATSSTPTPSTSTKPAATATTTPAQGVASTQSAATNQSAVAATTTTKLADTGPGNTISIFIAIMAVSYVLHRAYTVRRINR